MNLIETRTTHLIGATQAVKAMGLVLFMLLGWGAGAQGWQISFGAERSEEGWAVVETEDAGYLVAGAGDAPSGGFGQQIYLIRTDIDGRELWTKYYNEGFQANAKTIMPTPDGNFLIAGSIAATIGDKEDVFILKVDPKGEKLWFKTYGNELTDRASDIVLDEAGNFWLVGERMGQTDDDTDILVMAFDADGNLQWEKVLGSERRDQGNAIARLGQDLVVVGNKKNAVGFDNDIAIFRLDPQGAVVWEKEVASDFLEEGRDVIATADGNLVIAGLYRANSDALLIKMDPDGNQLWRTEVGTLFIEEGVNTLTELSDGSLVAAGFRVQEDGINVDMLLIKVDTDGNELWAKTVGADRYTDEARSIQATSDGGFILAGYNGRDLSFSNDVVLVKTDGLGNTITNTLTGRVFFDEDDNCGFDQGEQGLGGWLVEAIGANGQTYYGTTGADGYYNFLVDTGSYIVNVVPINNYWESCLTDGFPIVLTQFYDTTQIQIPVRALFSCPLLEVDISVPYLTPCDEVTYSVSYCNLGTQIAMDAFLEVTLDAILTFQSASMTPAEQTGNVLRFDLGDLAPGVCGAFTVTASSACSGFAEGQAAFVSAKIYPDTLCLEPDPNWDESTITVGAECNQDSITFQIENVGTGNMQEQRTSIVIQDDIIFLTIPFELRSKEDKRVRVPANGSTYRIIAEQPQWHPVRNYSTAAVEGCAEEGLAFSTGKVTQFPEYDEAPSESVDVQEITTFEAPVALLGYPKGYRDEQLIAPETDLVYKIVFTNTGDETVDRVVIRDTLPASLDVNRLIPGASSHPYTLEVVGKGVVRITFDNIALAPSAVDPASSLGFVEFKAPQKAGLPLDTEILNQATVYMDYQAPVRTNSTRHVVGDFPDFIEVVNVVDAPDFPGLKVRVFPNPFVQSAYFLLEGYDFQEVNFTLFDQQGRLIQSQEFSGNQFELKRTPNLKAGFYSFRLETGGQLISTGKLLVR